MSNIQTLLGALGVATTFPCLWHMYVEGGDYQIHDFWLVIYVCVILKAWSLLWFISHCSLLFEFNASVLHVSWLNYVHVIVWAKFRWFCALWSDNATFKHRAQNYASYCTSLDRLMLNPPIKHSRMNTTFSLSSTIRP